jgi:hypothetical protein
VAGTGFVVSKRSSAAMDAMDNSKTTESNLIFNKIWVQHPKVKQSNL